MIEYEDFSLKIEPKQGDVYSVIVLHSPAGECRSSFTLPFDPNEIGEILFDLGGTVRSSSKVTSQDVSSAATRTLPQQIGDQLFISLFTGPTRSLLDRSLGMIHGRQRGLRIKLHIDPEHPSLAQLASLPWEFLYRKETRDFLNLSRYTPIIRYLDVQRPYTPLPLELPLRILVVISDPVDYTRLDLDCERALIESSWARHEGVQVEFMEEATILRLQDRLSEQPYHVLHYMGHGGLDERTGRGVLIMEDEEGRGSIVDGRTLGILLRDLPMMRLAFLNACDTARVTKEKGLDPFAGVASAMVLAGIPAVVAMQFPISDDAAITFSQKFYPLLARGEPVDTAVAEGRRAIRLAENQTMEWGTPVLFLRAPQGVIFDVSNVQREQAPPQHTLEISEKDDEEIEKRLAVLYTRALNFFWLEDWEKAESNFQTIVKVNPNYKDANDKLKEAKRRTNLNKLYLQAESAEEAENWSIALAALEELTAEAPNFKDSAEGLLRIRKKKHLANLYSEAKHLHQAQQWMAVVNVFKQIHAIETDYPDPDGLFISAKQEVASLKRQEDLNDLYNQAVKEMDEGHWQEAHKLLTQLKEMKPGFLETEQLLDKAEKEIHLQNSTRMRLEHITTLYDQALGFSQACQWRQALAKMEEIQKLDPEFVDQEGIAAKARDEIRREEEKKRIQKEIAYLYAEAIRSLKVGNYQRALDKMDEVWARDPGYADQQEVHSKASKELGKLAKGSSSMWGLHRGKIVAISGAIILCGIVTVIYGIPKLSGLFPLAITTELTATMTPTSSEVFPGSPSPSTSEEPTKAPSYTPTLTAIMTPTFTLTPITPTNTSISTSTQTAVPPPPPGPYDFDIAFSSNKDGEFAIYLMDSNNPSQWVKLDRPSGYERIMWPSFCGSRIAAEVKDMDNEKRQWIYLISPEGYIEEWNPPGSPDQLGIPRCSTNGDFMSYTAFEEGKWVHTVADTSGDNRLMTDNTGLGISGYGSWFANDRDLLWMVQDGDIWIILITKDLQISNTLQLLPRETTSGEMIDQWRHPAISPDGTQYAFNCLIGDSSYICTADIEGSTAKTLRKIVREDVGVWVSVNPVWSKDGRWIYFNSAEDGDWDIYRMSPDGTNLENLTASWNSTEFHPATRW